MAAQSSGVVLEAAAGQRQWQCQGVGGGTSMDIGGGDGGGGGDRGEAVALALLARIGVGPLTRWLALRARGPGWQGGGSGTRFAWLALGSGR